MGRSYSKPRHPWVYAAYKGEKYLFEGTKVEICGYLGIKSATFNFYRSRYYKENRESHINNRIIIIRVDGEDKIWR